MAPYCYQHKLEQNLGTDSQQSPKALPIRDWNHVTLLCGVEEGSVVGPLFFIATLFDVTIVADDVMELLHIWHGLSVMVQKVYGPNFQGQPKATKASPLRKGTPLTPMETRC